MRVLSIRRRRIAGSLATVLVLAQLVWAGHALLHAPDTSDSCRVCVHLDRLDAVMPAGAAHFQQLTADQPQPAILAKFFFADFVERPRVRAPPGR